MENLKKPVRTRNRVELVSIGNFSYFTQRIGGLVGLTVGTAFTSFAAFFVWNETSKIPMPEVIIGYLCWLLFSAALTLSIYFTFIPNAKKIEVLPDTLSLRISEYWNNDDAIIVPLVQVLSVGKTGKHHYKLQIYSETEKGWVRFYSNDTGVEFLFTFFTGDVFNSDVKYLQDMVKYAKRMEPQTEDLKF